MQWAEAEKISYLVYSPESELSYDLFAIMDKLELIGSMGSYYDAYRLLRTQPLSGRYVLEELTVLTAASPKMRKRAEIKAAGRIPDVYIYAQALGKVSA